MPGLAATLGNPGLIDLLGIALAPRGAACAACRIDGSGGIAMEVAMRAGMPAVARVVGGPAGRSTLAALAVDGVASVTMLDSGYAAHGPAGLLGGPDPNAVVLADAERGALVLARNGDGPALYYAEHRDGWLAASEPAVLLAAGVPVEPAAQVVRRFVATGRCDDGEETFFAGIRRVLPDQAVVLGHDGVVTRKTAPARADVSGGHSGSAGSAGPETGSVAASLRRGVDAGRFGLRLCSGPAGAALLGVALARRDRPRPLPVFTAEFTEARSPGWRPAVLESLGAGLVRYTGYSFPAAQLDLDGFLRDLGEPVPDLDFYLLWEIVRGLGERLDTLVDSSGLDGLGAACAARVSDRLAARYGVPVRCPVRAAAADRLALDDLDRVIARTLPPRAVRLAMTDPAAPPAANGVLLAMRDRVAAALAVDRGWRDRGAELSALRDLCAGEPVDGGPLLRAYLVERWLALLPGHPAEGDPPSPSQVYVGGATWTRLPVRTELFAPGDEVAERAAWRVSNALSDTGLPTGEPASRPWFAVVAGKAVAVGQRRVCPLWEIKPGPAARLLARAARFGVPRLADPLTMQVAISDAGLARVALGILVAGVPTPLWYERLLPAAAIAVCPPRAGSVSPADAAVVRAPDDPNGFARTVARALQAVLPPDLASTLAGCAVVSADDTGCRVLGFAAGPYVDAVPDAVDVVARLCADNPAGQDEQRTPVVVAVGVPGRTARPGAHGWLGRPLVSSWSASSAPSARC